MEMENRVWSASPIRISCIGTILFAASAVFLLLSGGVAHAQVSTADVVGTVRDASGGVLPGATVVLTNTGTNVSRTVATSATGDYTFTLVQVGTYGIKVEAKGFKTFLAPNFTLSAGDRARVDAPMEVGELTQIVEVQEQAAPALQTDSSTLGTLVTQQAVQDIPLNGRNFVKLVQLSPGVTEGAPNELNSGNRPDDRRMTSTMSVNGQSDIINNNMIDGMDNNERIIGTIGVRPSVDAIQEVNVSTNLYAAEMGRTGGGVVDVITKSGSNHFHGSVYEFFRNKVLNTNPNYDAFAVGPKPPFRQNQYGGSLGGPIRRDKTFFFGDFEQFRQALGLVVSGLTVPTLCERGSILATAQATVDHVTIPSTITCPNSGGANVANPGNFSDTTTISFPGGSAGPGGPGPVIPVGSLTPLGLAYFSMYPLPTSSGTINNFSSNPTRTQNSTTLDGRIDQHFSDKDSFYGRYSFNDVTTVTPDGFPIVPIVPGTADPSKIIAGSGLKIHPDGEPNMGSNSFAGLAKERQQAISLSYVHIFRANLLLNLKASYLRSSIQSLSVNAGSNVSNALGFTCNSVTCINVPGLSAAGGLASVSYNDPFITNYTPIGDTAFIPLLQFDNTFQYGGALTWNRGAHSIKIGATLIRRRATINQSANAEGTFNFTGGYTGVPAGDLLEGLTAGGGGFLGLRSNTPVSPGYRTWEPSSYVQDDWRARKWLTLNLGLRYDIFTPFTEIRGRISNWDPATGLIVSPSASAPAAQRSGPTALVKTDYKNFAPRFGFAATLKHNTVIRGGFGMSYFPSNYASQSSLKNAPFNYSLSCGPQNNNFTGTPCPASIASPNVVQYGLPPSAGAGSSVGQSGGTLLAKALPVPVINFSQIVVPAGCTAAAGSGAAACQAPLNPYAGVSIHAAEWPDYPASYLEQYSLQVQKELASNVITIGYVGSLGRHINFGYSPNQQANPQQTQNPLATEFPWLATTPINENTQFSTSAYNALQTTFVRRFNRGLTVSFNYTWAHAMDNTGGGVNGLCQPTLGDGSASNPGFPCFYDNPANPGSPKVVHSVVSAYWGNSGLDVADRFAWTLDYELPFGKSMTGVEGAFVKGWAVNMAGFWQTGLPFTVTTDGSQNVTGTGNAGLPDQICSGRLPNPTLAEWFNPACFKLQTPGTFGDEHINQLFGPSQTKIDFSLFKEFPLTEKFRLQFRTEVFNLFNTPNFSTPSNTNIVDFSGPGNTGTAAGSVGAITTLNNNENSRQIQFGLKLLF